MHEVFSNITSMKVRVFSQKVGNNDYNFTEFVTLTHFEFTKYYELFYKDKKKIIPENISELLIHPRTLAVWIMDDGAAEYAGLSIQTHCFSEKEVNILINVIRNNFKLLVWSRKNKGKLILYFPKRSMERLINLVEPYFLEEMKYKLTPYFYRKPRRDCTPGSDLVSEYDTVRSCR